MVTLIIMSGFFPGKRYGGPPVSVDNFCSLMKGVMDCYIITSNHDFRQITPYENIKEGWNDRGNVKVRYLADEEYNSKSFNDIIHEIHPDYIYLQGLFERCILPCLRLAKKFGIKVVLAPRGELCAGAFRKKYKKIPYITLLKALSLLKNTEFQSTSEEETIAIKKWLGVKSDRIHSLTNIPSIPHNLPQRNKKQKGEGRFVFVSRILWKKNLLSAIKYFNEVNGHVTFDIYGPKEDELYWEECEKMTRALPENVVVNYYGVLSHDEIHRTFNQYDAFLFPTLSENYGHVIVEALVAGCIPIISDQTPWNDMPEFGSGWAIPLDDETSFKKAIQEVVDMDDDSINCKRDKIEKYLEKKLKLEEIKTSYLRVFK